MSRPSTMPISDQEIEDAVAALVQHAGNKAAAARALNIPETSFRRRIHAAAERGLLGTQPVLPGYHISRVSQQTDGDGNLEREWLTQTKEPIEPGEKFLVPDGQVIKGLSTLTDAQGRVLNQWVKTDRDRNEIDWVAVFKAAFEGYEGKAEPIPAPSAVDTDFLNLIPCNDWHINLLTWSREVAENWDLKIAERVIGGTIDTVIDRLRPAATAVVLGGGDLMHNDDNSNRTAKSGNLLEADGRHAKGIEVAQRLKVRTIEAALKKHNKVLVRILKGNHDEQSAVAIAHFLYAWFRNEPRVEVDLDQSLYWFHQFGKVMLAATHGHTAKLAQLPSIMAHRRAEMWGATKFRYAHGFHIHHKEKVATEGNGVICESHQAPIPQDSWHYGEGYLAGRSMQAITYHKDHGEFGRVIEAVLEAGKSKRLAA